MYKRQLLLTPLSLFDFNLLITQQFSKLDEKFSNLDEKFSEQKNDLNELKKEIKEQGCIYDKKLSEIETRLGLSLIHI